jgi:hypothetical protein
MKEFEPKRTKKAFQQLGFYEVRNNKHLVMKREGDINLISLKVNHLRQPMNIGLIKRELNKVNIPYDMFLNIYNKV